MVDKIIQGKSRTRRQYASYYTDSDPILSYMVKKLSVSKGDSIFEPCAGDGAFIDKIISQHNLDEIKIDAVDLNPVAVKNLKDKFSDCDIKISLADTLLDFESPVFQKDGYSRIIGNPPYGAWQDLSKRKKLKSIYGGYVKETYTLFLQRSIDLLKDNGRLVFIIPDTFLALHMHKGIRKKMLNETRVEEILLFPSRFFPGVSFGYSNLCIVTLVKDKSIKNHLIKIATVKDSVDRLVSISNDDYSQCDSVQKVKQDEILSSSDMAFMVGSSDISRKLMSESTVRLGDIADCVTGFYSGDNKTYIKALDENVRRSKGYGSVDLKEVETKQIPANELKKGLKNKKYIPYLKNAIGTFALETEWYIRWDEPTIEHYKKDKRARFQNSEFYFRDGIGMPMIKSSNTHAILLEKRLFDQSVVGIFPKNIKHTDFLLAFLNSHACSRLLSIINHTANNSANYLKKLPIIIDERTLSSINKLMEQYYVNADKNEVLTKINEIFDELYCLD